MKTIAIIGHTGVVGSALVDEASRRGLEAIGVSRSARPPHRQWDLLSHTPPDLPDVDAVFLTAALTNVDRCEQDPELSRAVNYDAVVRLARWCAARNVHLIFYSSDYVFDGASGPYDESATTSPINVYGGHKRDAERALAELLPNRHTILRTTVVFGFEPAAKNFALALRDRLRAGERMRVPCDQVGTPTWSRDLAAASFDLVQAGARGIFHVAGATRLSRADFARIAARTFELDENLVESVTTAELAQPAARPLSAGLVSSRLAGVIGRPMLELADALRRFASEL